MRISVGIFAYNAGDTVATAIQAFLDQETPEVSVAEVLVVCSGCTDATVEICTARAVLDQRVRIMVRPQREGKVAAINQFLKMATGEILILSGADVIPGRGLVDALVRPMMSNSQCAMTGARVTSAPVVSARPAARLHELLWRLHHEVAVRSPKLGETIAVRRSYLPRRLPPGIACDEVLIEWLVRGRGGSLAYLSHVAVNNFPPRTVEQLYRQRRRISCQHVVARRQLGYRPATMRWGNIAAAVRAVLRRDGRVWAWLLALGLTELAARVHGRWDALRGRRYNTWRPVERRVAPLPIEGRRNP